MYTISNAQLESIIRMLKLVQKMEGKGSVIANRRRLAGILIRELSNKKPSEQ